MLVGDTLAFLLGHMLALHVLKLACEEVRTDLCNTTRSASLGSRNWCSSGLSELAQRRPRSSTALPVSSSRGCLGWRRFGVTKRVSSSSRANPSARHFLSTLWLCRHFAVTCVSRHTSPPPGSGSSPPKHSSHQSTSSSPENDRHHTTNHPHHNKTQKLVLSQPQQLTAHNHHDHQHHTTPQTHAHTTAKTKSEYIP